MTLAEVCNELEEALEALDDLEARQGDDYSSAAVEWCERCVHALVALGDLLVLYALETGDRGGSSYEEHEAARERLEALKAKEVLGGS